MTAVILSAAKRASSLLPGPTIFRSCQCQRLLSDDMRHLLILSPDEDLFTHIDRKEEFLKRSKRTDQICLNS